MMLSAEEYSRVKDLCRVYGASELCDYLSVDRTTVELALKSDSEIAERSVKRIRSGIRLYWKVWMGKHRGHKPLDKRYRVIRIAKEGETTCPSSLVVVPAPEPESSTLLL